VIRYGCPTGHKEEGISAMVGTLPETKWVNARDIESRLEKMGYNIVEEIKVIDAVVEEFVTQELEKQAQDFYEYVHSIEMTGSNGTTMGFRETVEKFLEPLRPRCGAVQFFAGTKITCTKVKDHGFPKHYHRSVNGISVEWEDEVPQ
jgi:hypothetical protein